MLFTASGQVGHRDAQATAHNHGLCTHTRRVPTAANVAQQLHAGLDNVSAAPGDELLDQRPVLRPTSQGCGDDCECLLVPLKGCVRPVGGDGCGSDVWSPIEVIEWVDAMDCGGDAFALGVSGGLAATRLH